MIDEANDIGREQTLASIKYMDGVSLIPCGTTLLGVMVGEAISAKNNQHPMMVIPPGTFAGSPPTTPLYPQTILFDLFCVFAGGAIGMAIGMAIKNFYRNQLLRNLLEEQKNVEDF